MYSSLDQTPIGSLGPKLLSKPILPFCELNYNGIFQPMLFKNQVSIQ